MFSVRIEFGEEEPVEVRHYKASRMVVVNGKAAFTDTFLADLPRQRGLFVLAGPIRSGNMETCELVHVTDYFRHAQDLLDLALSARSARDKDECIRAALAQLTEIDRPLLASEAMAASLQGS